MDVKTLVVTYVIGIIIMQIVFFKENFLFINKVVAAFFWMFIFPGFVFSYLWDKLSFLERITISVPMSAALVGIVSYYVSFAGIHAKFHTFIVPILLIVMAIIMNWVIKKKA